jgi:hypothetical protein
MDFPHCADCLQLGNIASVETYKRPLEAVHDSVSHALQPPKPTITACDTDNTATSVKKNTIITRKIVQLMKIVHVQYT